MDPDVLPEIGSGFQKLVADGATKLRLLVVVVVVVVVFKVHQALMKYEHIQGVTREPTAGFSALEITSGDILNHPVALSALTPDVCGQILWKGKPLAANPTLRHLVPMLIPDVSLHLEKISTSLTAIFTLHGQQGLLLPDLPDIQFVSE